MSPVAESWSIAGGTMDLRGGVLVGVLNVTPDSFSDGGMHDEHHLAVRRGIDMVSAGAQVVDVGGESTRPGSRPVSLEEEIERALPVVRDLVGEGITVSIDTYKPELAALAVEEGAAVVNDVTGLEDDAMVGVVADSDVGVVVMHGRGQPLDRRPPDVDVVGEVEGYLTSRARHLIGAGIDASRIAVDPGLGFAKRHRQSVALLAGVDRLARHGFPVMVGASRKRFIGHIAGAGSWESRDGVTAVISALTYLRGARLFRVHDVARSRDALRMAGAIVAIQ